MRLLCFSVLVGLMVGSAEGAVLWMEFEDGSTEATLYPSESVGVDVFVELSLGDSLSGVTFAFEEAPGLDLTGGDTSLEGWDETVQTGNVGLLSTSYAAMSQGDVYDVSEQGTYHIGSFNIHLYAYSYPDVELTFLHDETDLLTAEGWPMTFGPSLAGVVPNFFDYGLGSPGVPSPVGVHPRFPLIVNCVPEPGSLALLALGGLALLRRR